MQIGISTSAFACERIEDPERDLERFLAFWRRLRLESVQIELPCVEGYSGETSSFGRNLKRIRNRLRKEKIYTWTGSALDVSEWGAESDADFGPRLQEAFRLIESGDPAGMTVLDVTGVPESSSPEWDRFVGRYGKLVEHAARCRVKLAARCTAATFDRLRQQIPDPDANGLCLCLAACHKAGESAADVAASVGDLVFHAHASDVKSDGGEWQPALLGRGEVDAPRAVRELSRRSWLPVTVTHCPVIAGLDNDQAPVAWGVAYLRGLLPSGATR